MNTKNEHPIIVEQDFQEFGERAFGFAVGFYLDDKFYRIGGKLDYDDFNVHNFKKVWNKMAKELKDYTKSKFVICNNLLIDNEITLKDCDES